MSKENPTFVDEKKELYMKKEHYLTIFPDYGCVISNEEAIDFPCCEDEIANSNSNLSPKFSFVVPGLYEWFRRYEDKTDFTILKRRAEAE